MFMKAFLSIIPALLLVSGAVTESLNSTDTTCSNKPFHKQDKYKVGLLLYDEFIMLDIIGAGGNFGGNPEKFDVHVIGNKPNSKTKAKTNAFKLYNNMTLSQANALNDKDAFDIVVIPGGTEGTQRFINDKELIGQVKKLADRAKIVFSVGTGSLILAKAGLLDNKCATTTKMEYKKRTPQYPTVKWQPKARWVHDGKYLTSSGVTAGMDASYYLRSELVSREQAELGAKGAEYTPIWDSKDDPFAIE